MFKFELYVPLDSIADSVIHRSKALIAQLINNTDEMLYISIDGDTEVRWCPTGNFDKDPVYEYRKYTVYPRDLKILIKGNKDWRKDKRVQVVKENKYIIYKKENADTKPIKEIKLDKVTKYSDICEILEKYM